MNWLALVQALFGLAGAVAEYVTRQRLVSDAQAQALSELVREQYRRLNRVKELRDTGLSPDDIKRLLKRPSERND